MKSPRLPIGSTPSLWPNTKAGVMEIAQAWYDPSIARVDDEAIKSLDLGHIEVGAETGMAAGKLGMDWSENIGLSLALNSINYQFWDLGGQGEFLRYSFEGVVGAQGMRNAFERAWNDPESPMSQARRGVPLTGEAVRAMFGDIPSVDTRVAVLNEVLLPPKLDQISKSLAAQYAASGEFTTQMAHQVAEAFPLAYGDQVLKKAQLAISEMWVKAVDAGDTGSKCDLTAFADYQIPNILRAMGVLKYSDDLAAKIDGYQEIPYESAEEKAIRAASLIAVEKLAVQAGVPVAAVDHYLWTRRKEATTPFHLTFTTAY